MKLSTQKQILVLLCAVLVFAVLCLCLWGISSSAGAEKDDSHAFAVYFTEILSSNSAYPDHNGNLHDYVELCNGADGAVDISGFHLTDNKKEIKYTFPDKTYLEPGEYILVWCESGGKDTADFSISKSGGETIYLMNRKNVIVDSVVTIPTKKNLPMVRENGDSWTLASYATPGFPNSKEGHSAYLASRTASGFPVVISELMASNASYPSPDGNPYDFIELHNPTEGEVDLSGCWISDDPEKMKDSLPKGSVLGPGEYLLLWCGGENGLSFKLASEGGETVSLLSPGGDVIDSVTTPAMKKDSSLARKEDGSREITFAVTPGSANAFGMTSADPAGESLNLSELPHSESPTLVVSELMTDNTTTLFAANAFPDWIEIENRGKKAESLKGYFLSDDPAKLGKYPCPDLTLKPGEFVLFLCDGSGEYDGSFYHTNFSLSRHGESLLFINPLGELASGFAIPESQEDQSFVFEDGKLQEAKMPTPGYPNTDKGEKAFRESQAVPIGVMLSEVMTANNTFLQQADGKYYDWVELYNNGNETVDLSGYSLSDNFADSRRYIIAELTLEPGEYTSIVLSDGSLGLNSQDESLYLFDPDGICLDAMRITGLGYQMSYGRMPGKAGFFYFEEPTPGKENRDGKAGKSSEPVVSEAPGVYNGVSSLKVSLSGEGTIYYTLDGSWPTEKSRKYKEVLELDSTTVLRAICVEENSVPSETLSASYIINENHIFPVLSLTMDPDGFAYMYQNYYSDIEERANLTFFDNDGESFSIDCGACIFGSLSRETLAKKSLKVVFRGEYGSKRLHYPLYENSNVEDFKSLVLRSGQDSTFAMIREELMTSLAKDGSDSLQTVNTRYAVLYVNGEYWGIYNLKEAFSEEFFASHNNVSVDSTKLVRMTKLVDEAPELWEIISNCHRMDMSDPENYRYLTDNVDVESMADWIIYEAYCSNSDLLNNVRYVMSKDLDGKWKHCYYDLDWSFRYQTATLPIRSGEVYAYLPKAALQNEEFKSYFLERLAYHLKNSLSTDHVNGRIDELTGLLAPEMERDWDRWNLNLYNYESNVQNIRDYVADRPTEMISQICDFLGVSSAERSRIFGGIS